MSQSTAWDLGSGFSRLKVISYPAEDPQPVNAEAGRAATTELPRGAGPDPLLPRPPRHEAMHQCPNTQPSQHRSWPRAAAKGKGKTPGPVTPEDTQGCYKCSRNGIPPGARGLCPGQGRELGHTSVPRLDFKCRRASGPSWLLGARSERAAAMELAVKDITCMSCRRRVWRAARPPPALTRALRCFPT